MKLFSSLYYFLSALLYVVALPLLLLLLLKRKYKDSIPARFFLFKNKRFSKEGGVWFHVCSLGEARALKPLIQRLQNVDIKISVITHTGYEAASKYDKETRYLPFEIFLPFWIRPQKLLVVLEAEFWYMLFAVIRACGGKVILLNARISEKSVKRYMKMRWFYKRVLSFVDKVYCQSEIDAYRFETLGAKDIEIIGNIKLAQEIEATHEYVKPKKTTIVAASTHEGEEKLILSEYHKYLQTDDALLIVAPRHPERFDNVYLLLEQFAKANKLSLSRLSKDDSFTTDIVLVDIMGELNNVYNVSDIAIMGGSFFEKIGGHNPLEPAHFGCKIITGRYFHDQRELFGHLFHVQYVDNDEICNALQKSEELPGSFVSQKIDLDNVIEYIQQENLRGANNG